MGGKSFLRIVRMVFLIFFISLGSIVFAGSTLWEVVPTDGVFFQEAVCNPATQHYCPSEMGWEGKTIYFAFTLPDVNLPQKLTLYFNVVNINWGGTKDVLLRISAGKSKSSLVTVVSSLDINRVGDYYVQIDSSLFKPGATNYIKFYGTNISPTGYGTNPPNFRMSFVALQREDGDSNVVACYKDSDCGADYWVTGTEYCVGNNVYQERQFHICSNPGEQQSSCLYTIGATQLKESCSNGCSYGHCVSAPISNTIWVFSNFVPIYKVFSTYTCDINKVSALPVQYGCPAEYGWEGNKVKFKFKLDGNEQFTDLLKFYFDVSTVFTSEKVDIYAGAGEGKKVVSGILVDHPDVYVAEVPSRLFKKGANFVTIKINGLSVGYGKPTQGLVLESVALANYRDYIYPSLDCPLVVLDKNSLLTWQDNDFAVGDKYLDFSYKSDFSKNSYSRYSVKSSPKAISKWYKSLLKLESKSIDGNLYVRLYVNSSTRGKVYSNVCVVRIV